MIRIFLPGILLKVESDSPSICLKPLGTFLFNKELIPTEITFQFIYDITDHIEKAPMKTVLKGEPFEGVDIPYRWEILKSSEAVGIYVDYFEDFQIQELICHVDFGKKIIYTRIVPQRENLTIDPLLEPLGSMLMVILAHFQNDVLIHASGIMDQGKGRLFTAVSGTGKSTMAELWQRSGADIINDDRLWLHHWQGQWYFFNTPMPYYAQRPAMAPLHEIFLLRQSIQNELKRMSGIEAAMRFMANAIQHYFDKRMTEQHLERIFDIARAVPIYDCGFRPDKKIVEEIRGLNELSSSD
ncbi:hypothetical protein [Thermophagus xiamenensis]|uniref:Hpr(Ser) kinase/phosphatase n=1 Tax=Thermophagus xiamenensis TaxID=385682 RepID=A0A1I1XJ48_9BACT|nr:hypothetical protein [Thermophagus xiamenensis]SFE07395.1 hypothetical protein SAMN05444380_10662 [Thermophagus xiamenensis]